jgi:hypothetical protein
MADASTGDGLRCAYCATPILRTEQLVEVNGLLFCCPNCELAARNPEASRRARRGGGLVLTCAHCATPIIFSEIMVIVGGFNYCCDNCAEAARIREPDPVSTT